eukprot:5828149-Lingulodinium_polyedra.AAC.1
MRHGSSAWGTPSTACPAWPAVPLQMAGGLLAFMPSNKVGKVSDLCFFVVDDLDLHEAMPFEWTTPQEICGKLSGQEADWP